MQRLDRVRSLAVALPAVVLFALATAFALREGLAELHAQRANELIAQWESGRPPSPRDFDSVERSILSAIDLSPSNGDHWESLGSAWFARASAPGRTVEGRLRDFDRAVEAYREATRRSTVSAYAWANLMLAKHRAGQLDPEFSLAIRNAARFGPHEVAVQAMILATVLPRWVDVDGLSRRLAAETVARGWSSNREVLVAEASSAPARELWCDPALWPPEASLASAMRQLCADTAPGRSGRGGAAAAGTR